MIEGVENRDNEAVARHLTAYVTLLTEHITKEDDILYPYIDRGLSGEQIRDLVRKFKEADDALAIDTGKYERWIEGLEKNRG